MAGSVVGLVRVSVVVRQGLTVAAAAAEVVGVVAAAVVEALAVVSVEELVTIVPDGFLSLMVGGGALAEAEMWLEGPDFLADCGCLIATVHAALQWLVAVAYAVVVAGLGGELGPGPGLGP